MMLPKQNQNLCLLSSLELSLGDVQSDRQAPSLTKKPRQTVKAPIAPAQPSTDTEDRK